MTSAAAPLPADSRVLRATPRAVDAAGAARAESERARARLLPPIGADESAIDSVRAPARAVVIAPAAWRRGGATTRDAAGYVAQRAAQAQDRQGLHLEDWRGATLAYAAALRTAPEGAPPRAISLLA